MDQSLSTLFTRLLSEALNTSVIIQHHQSLGGGCINHAGRLSTSEGVFFVKWNAQGPEDMFLREAECLEELAKANTSLVIPRVFVRTALTSEEPAVLVTEFLEAPLSPRHQLDEQLGLGLAQLHRHQQEQHGFYHNNYCGATPQDNRWQKDWVNFFGQQRIAYLLGLIRKKHGMGPSEQKVYDRLLDAMPLLIAHQPPASLNHGDLWSGNYMHSSRGPALIDPASYYADREFDLAMMGMFGGFSQRVWDAYQEAYPLPAEWQQRHELYMLYHYLNHYFLFGGHYGQQALSIARRYV